MNMVNHIKMERIKAYAGIVLVALAAVALAPSVSAAELGMNYYHESMMGTWGGQYIPRTMDEVSQDLDLIQTKTNNIKLYANPMVDGNVDWTLRIADEAKRKGMHVVLAMNTEDRELHDGNFWDYKNRVLDACSAANGRVDEFIVGNEVGLHSPWNSWEIRERFEPLINECSFSGPTTYEIMWWDREAWKGYNGRLYFNMYEYFDSFSTNIKEMDAEWGSNAYIGEWGDNFGSEWDQAREIERRWTEIDRLQVPVAYVFTFKEPSSSGDFGLIRNDGSKKPGWDKLPNSGSTYTPPTRTPSTGTADIGHLRDVCSADGGCWEKQDVVMGDCRALTYGTSRGDIRALACLKGDSVELYRQDSPSGSWTLALGEGRITNNKGFDRFPMSSSEESDDSDDWQEPERSAYSGIGSLDTSFASSAGGWKVQDSTSGTCRTIRYGTNAGEAKVMACEKGDAVEMYVQQAPSTQWKLSLDAGSVGSHTGFARFTPSGDGSGSDDGADDHQSDTKGWSATHNARVKFADDSGTCRKAGFDTDAGYIEAQACDKGGHWELYLKSGPNDASISYKGMSVGPHSGFDRT